MIISTLRTTAANEDAGRAPSLALRVTMKRALRVTMKRALKLPEPFVAGDEAGKVVVDAGLVQGIEIHWIQLTEIDYGIGL